jgi:hypothetical protein
MEIGEFCRQRERRLPGYASLVLERWCGLAVGIVDLLEARRLRFVLARELEWPGEGGAVGAGKVISVVGPSRAGRTLAVIGSIGAWCDGEILEGVEQMIVIEEDFGGTVPIGTSFFAKLSAGRIFFASWPLVEGLHLPYPVRVCGWAVERGWAVGSVARPAELEFDFDAEKTLLIRDSVRRVQGVPCQQIAVASCRGGVGISNGVPCVGFDWRLPLVDEVVEVAKGAGRAEVSDVVLLSGGNLEVVGRGESKAVLAERVRDNAVRCARALGTMSSVDELAETGRAIRSLVVRRTANAEGQPEVWIGSRLAAETICEVTEGRGVDFLKRLYGLLDESRAVEGAVYQALCRSALEAGFNLLVQWLPEGAKRDGEEPASVTQTRYEARTVELHRWPWRIREMEPKKVDGQEIPLVRDAGWVDAVVAGLKGFVDHVRDTKTALVLRPEPYQALFDLVIVIVGETGLVELLLTQCTIQGGGPATRAKCVRWGLGASCRQRPG